MEVSNPHTFYFDKLEERTAVMDWAKAQGWKVTTDILFTTNGLTAMRHVRNAVREACEYFHLPVPEERAYGPAPQDPSQGA
jgi:hypothetical protein